MPAEQPEASKPRHQHARRITVTLPAENYELLTRMAKNKKVSASWVVRDAVDKYLAADMPLFRQTSTTA